MKYKFMVYLTMCLFYEAMIQTSDSTTSTSDIVTAMLQELKHPNPLYRQWLKDSLNDVRDNNDVFPPTRWLKRQNYLARKIKEFDTEIKDGRIKKLHPKQD